MKIDVQTDDGQLLLTASNTMPGELIEVKVDLVVLAAGMNNTEINTRLGWYSSSIRSGTNSERRIALFRPEIASLNVSTAPGM